MKFVDEFRDPAAARSLLTAIGNLADGDRHYKFMEVCGGHTHTIYRHGIEHLLPSNVELVHGPGCPVCVIPMGRVDDAMWLAEQPDVIFTCFGDMMRVPGSRGSLLDAKARGADVRFVYSPLDALKLAVDNPSKQVVFFALGFETTAPSTAVTLVRARELGVTNFSVFCNHVTIVPPLKAILDSPDLRLDGFLGPGHVSTVVGNKPYRFVPEQYGLPIVVAGFEPLDILASVAMLLKQLREGRCEVENQYSRVVHEDGNPAALALMGQVFALRPHFEWRGLGFISQSALALNADYAEFDAEVRYAMPGVRVADPKACQCGEVLKGVLKPWECKVFGTACTPETPIGTCMVSPEGACAAYYNFGRLHREAAHLVAGTDLFARYAHAPNALGFCGPSSGVGGSETQVRAAARRFSGAWPYLQVLARLTGTDDPLDARLVEAYWLGRDLGVDNERFGKELLEVIGPQAGHYWTHLTPELLASGAPDHGFHVFGVYPWSRLLGVGPEPLHVLDSCRIRWGVVVGRDEQGVEVETSHLTWDKAGLGLGEPTVERIPAVNVQVDVGAGDQVALHWEWLCDHLAPAQRDALEASTRRELAATTARRGTAVT